MIRLLALLLLLPSVAFAYQIPKWCKDIKPEASAQIPYILGLSKSAAHITKIDVLADLPRYPIARAMNGQPARYEISCPLRVYWSNGQFEIDYFREWRDRYGQVRDYFGPDG